MPWYKGKTLIQALSDLRTPSKEHLYDKPFRFIAHKIEKVHNVGTVVMGRVVSGRLVPGMEVCMSNYRNNLIIKDIEMHKNCYTYEALAGDYASFTVVNNENSQMFH